MRRAVKTWRRMPGKQRGMVLIVMLVILILGGAYFLVGKLSRARSTIENDQQTALALAKAREALLAYAASDQIRPGELPCPDFNNDGQIVLFGPNRDYNGSNCRTLVGGVVRPGWLPWGLLRLSDLRDGTGERLWYVVFNPYHANAGAVLNSDGPISTMAVDGTSDIVAIVFSPGTVLAGQNGRPGSDALAAVGSYLEGENADGDLGFVTAAAGTNDRVVMISRDDILRAVERRVALEVRAVLRTCTTGFPPAAPFVNPTMPSAFVGAVGTDEGHLPTANWPGGCAVLPGWLVGNNWHHVIYYAIGNGGAACVVGSDCITVNGWPGVTNDKQAILIMTGQSLGPAHPSATLADYVEGDNASISDRVFEVLPITSTFNDNVYVVAP